MALAIATIVSFYGVGLGTAGHAVMTVRSSRGAVAWAISLVTFPFIALPMYWLFGSHKFYGYANAHRYADREYRGIIQQVYQDIRLCSGPEPENFKEMAQLADELTQLPFTSGNAATLLIDGTQTFPALLKAMDAAKDYILIQFYIVREDEIGHAFKEKMIAKSREGVRVYFIYDAVGSYALSPKYLRELRRSGVWVTSFNSSKRRRNRFQLNFRNHRKILIVDGKQAFIGGLNLGKEYLGKDPRLSPWRDTHLEIKGPSVQCIQVSFLKDWYWAVREIPEVHWTIQTAEENQTAIVVPTGPGDQLPACTLFVVSLINAARRRLWITSPYFVPDESVLTALKLAALRGVDVRILLPSRPDHIHVYLASFSYITEVVCTGVKVYRYRPGFMHQKVFLVDRTLAGVGTTNLDNRSFHINFEMMAFVTNHRFVTDVETMLTSDFDNAYLVDHAQLAHHQLWFRLAVRVARLMSPIL
nr:MULTISPECIES: cardiolipin synthase [unclassified Laspinema]